MANEVKYFVKKVGTDNRTKDLNLTSAMKKLKAWSDGLEKDAEDRLALAWEKDTEEKVWLPRKELFDRVVKRLDNASPGIDAFVSGVGDGILRIKTIEDLPEPPSWSGASPELSKMLDDLWREFPGDWQNWGIHVCRKIYGSSSWSQHSWNDAVDVGVGNDKQAGDDIHRWLNANENKYGGFCENIWWEVPSTGDATQDHRDHIHVSLGPCHTGTPPCA